MSRKRPEMLPLPSFASGGALVDVADRESDTDFHRFPGIDLRDPLRDD